MAVDVEELKGRGGTDKSLKRSYLVTGTSDEAAVLDAIYDEAPGRIADLPLEGIWISEDKDLTDTYWAEATYGITDKDDPAEDSVEYRFSYQAPSYQITQSLETIASYAATGTAEDFKGAINVVSDGNKRRVEGFNLAPPPVTFTLAYFPANGTVSTAYQLLLEGLVGKVNSTTYKGRAAGSLMLAAANGGARNNAGWSIDFGFAYIPNLTSIPVGDITVSAKDGMDLLWAYYADEPGDNIIAKRPKYAYVERVFYRADFNVLGL